MILTVARPVVMGVWVQSRSMGHLCWRLTSALVEALMMALKWGQWTTSQTRRSMMVG